MDKSESKKRRVRRNKHRMRLDLLNAVRDVLREQGFLHLNVNTVAQKADVDRNAIYRHFGSFDELLSQYIAGRDYWLESLEEIRDHKIDDYKLFMKQMIIEQYEQLNRNPEHQQMIIWELSELSLRTKAIAQRREMLAKKLIQQYEDYFADSTIDINVIVAIIIAGIYYLTIHKKHSTFCLVDFVKEKDRSVKAIDQFIEILFEAREGHNKAKEIAGNAINKGLDVQLVSEITGLGIDEINSLPK